MNLQSNWIWFETELREGVFACCRKTFELDAPPSHGLIAITCSGRYRLFVNGMALGGGPAHASPAYKKVDAWDVRDRLRAGCNLVAIELVHFGYSTAHSPASPPGLFCQIDLDDRLLAADETWRLCVDPCFSRETTRRNNAYGPVEIYDARLETDWRENPRFDDRSWAAAEIVRNERGEAGPTVAPWERMLPCRTPPCRETPLLPEQVVMAGEVLNQEFCRRAGNDLPFELPHYLLMDVPEESRHTRIEHPENALRDDDQPAVIVQPSPLDHSQPNQYAATMIVDFGREITAYGWLDVEGNADAVIDICYGELMRAGRVPAVVSNTAYVDRYILKEGRQRHRVYDWKGYRYVQLTFRNLTRPLKLYAVGADFTSYPLDPAGTFECSAPEMTRIWEVGAYTQQLCTHDRLMDCPWREQREWLGDGRVQLLILQNAFGAWPMVGNMVRNFAESQLADGQIPCCSHYAFMQANDYALWWVQAVLDAVTMTGDRTLAEEMLPHAERLFDWFEPFRNAGGLLENVPGWTFIDWADVGKAGICAPLNAIYCIALDAGAAVADWCGNERLRHTFRTRADAVRGTFHDTFWCRDRELYCDNIADGSRSGRFSRHTQAIAVVAGLHRVEARDLMLRAMDDDSLVPTEPYFSFYLCEALGIAGLAQHAYDFIRKRWGAMIGAGATSFWEEWQVEGSFRDSRWLGRCRSHCHAWSAAPTAWLSRYVLGVRPTTLDGPLVIAPQPCGLSAAKGTVPTRYGLLTVDWQVRGGGLELTLSVPDGLRYDVREPADFNGRTEVRVQ